MAMVTELFNALREAGISEPAARSAALAVSTKQDINEIKLAIADLRSEIVVLRADMKVAMADTKSDLIKWNVGAMAVLTAIFAAIVRLA